MPVMHYNFASSRAATFSGMEFSSFFFLSSLHHRAISRRGILRIPSNAWTISSSITHPLTKVRRKWLEIREHGEQISSIFNMSKARRRIRRENYVQDITF